MEKNFWFKFYLATEGSENYGNIWLSINATKYLFTINIYLIKFFIQINLWFSIHHTHRISFHIWNTYKKMNNRLFFKINKNV